MVVKIGINGFGRIGRNIFRQALGNPNVEVVAVNDLSNAHMLAHLLKYDSVHRVLNQEVSVSGSNIIVNDKELRVLKERDPTNIKWGKLGVDIVIEATGQFTNKKDAQKHIDSGAKKVIISAPSEDADLTVVMGANEQQYIKEQDHIISNASCTTNCLAPFAMVLNDKFGIKRGLMTTVHAYTTDQQVLDLPHEDYRRARAAAENIVPTSTGAAKAVGEVLPELDGKLNGMAMRVPVANGSVIDLVAELDEKVSAEEVNKAFKMMAEGKLKDILSYTEDPIVSTDIIGNTHSTIVDGLSTMIIEDTLVKVVAWYDNETAYSARCIDLAQYIKKQGL